MGFEIRIAGDWQKYYIFGMGGFPIHFARNPVPLQSAHRIEP